MKLLLSHPESLTDFNRWVDLRMQQLTNQIVMSATDMQQIFGFRYMLGELEAMRSLVNYGVVEQQQLSQLEGYDDGGRESELDDWC